MTAISQAITDSDITSSNDVDAVSTDVLILLSEMKSSTQWSNLLHASALPDNDTSLAGLVKLRAGSVDAPKQVHIAGRGRFLRAVAPNSRQLHSGTEWLFEVHADATSSPDTSLWQHFDAFVVDLCRTRGLSLWHNSSVTEASAVWRSPGCQYFPMYRTFREMNGTPAHVPLIAKTITECDDVPMIQVRDRRGLLLWPSRNEDGTGEPLINFSTVLSLCRQTRDVEYVWVLDGISHPHGQRFLVPFGILTSLTLLAFDYNVFMGHPETTVAEGTSQVTSSSSSSCSNSVCVEDAFSSNVKGDSSNDN